MKVASLAGWVVLLGIAVTGLEAAAQESSGSLDVGLSGATSETPAARVGRAQTRLDLIQRWNDWTLEGGAEAIEGQEVSRDDWRLVYEDRANGWEWTLGDLPDSSGRGQSLLRTSGVGVRKGWRRALGRTAVKLNETEYLLQREAWVETEVEGRSMGRRRLVAGRYDLRDQVLSAGIDRIRLQIRDDAGRLDLLEFDPLFDDAVLAEGEQEFANWVGRPWRESGGRREFDQRAAMTSLHHRYGFSDQFTAGMTLQNFLYQSVAGLEALRRTNWGTFALRGKISDIIGVRGAAGLLQWRSGEDLSSAMGGWRTAAEFEMASDTYFPLTTGLLNAPPFEKRFDLSSSGTLNRRWTAGFGLSVEAPFFQEEWRREVRAKIGWLPDDRWRVDIGMARRDDGVIVDDRASLDLTWREGSGRDRARMTAGDQLRQIAINHRIGDENPRTDLGLTATKESDQDRVEFDGETRGPSALGFADLAASRAPAGETRSSLIGLSTSLTWGSDPVSWRAPTPQTSPSRVERLTP